jgi:hypothetical protein
MFPGFFIVAFKIQTEILELAWVYAFDNVLQACLKRRYRMRMKKLRKH